MRTTKTFFRLCQLQADLSLRQAQMSEGMLPQDAAHIISNKCLVNVKLHSVDGIVILDTFTGDLASRL